MIKAAVFIYLIWPAIAFCYIPNKYTALSAVAIALYVSPLTLISEKFSEVRKQYFSTAYLQISIILNILIGAVNLGLIADQTSHSLTDLLKPEQLVAISSSSISLMYSTDVESINIGSPILLSLNLFSTYFCGRQSHQFNVVSKVLFFLPLMFYSILTTAKFPTYLAISFYFVGTMVKYSSGNLVWGRLGKSIIWLTLFGCWVLVLAMTNRGHDLYSIGFTRVIGNYLFAQYHAFGVWILDLGGASECCRFGESSFIGPLSWMGFFERQAGIYDQNIKVYDLETNIFTAWRFLIEDFSLIGPFVLNLIIALFYTVADSKVYWLLRMFLREYLMLSAMLAFTTGVFVYNCVALTLFMTVLYNYFLQKRSSYQLLASV